jgi:hypothetical protein
MNQVGQRRWLRDHKIRLDAIPNEALTRGADLRALADLFGLSMTRTARSATIGDCAVPTAVVT